MHSVDWHRSGKTGLTVAMMPDIDLTNILVPSSAIMHAITPQIPVWNSDNARFEIDELLVRSCGSNAPVW